jgi:NADH-quinone oxidoreductase subunit M
MLNTYKKVMFGPESAATIGFSDIGVNEKAVLIPIVIMIFWIGLYPKTFTDIAQPAVEQLVNIINK